jgi:hypothetical protein
VTAKAPDLRVALERACDRASALDRLRRITQQPDELFLRRARELVRDVALELALALTLARAIDRRLAVDLEHARELVRDLDDKLVALLRDLDREYDRDYALAGLRPTAAAGASARCVRGGVRAVSALARITGAGAAAAGTGTWVSLSGWPAADVVSAVFGVALVAGVALLLWVLASDARTGRVLRIIAAVRFQRR